MDSSAGSVVPALAKSESILLLSSRPMQGVANRILDSVKCKE